MSWISECVVNLLGFSFFNDIFGQIGYYMGMLIIITGGTKGRREINNLVKFEDVRLVTANSNRHDEPTTNYIT